MADLVSGVHDWAEARFHLHPNVNIDPESSGGYGKGLLPNGHAFSWQVEVGEGRIEPATWHPHFGATEHNVCIVLRLNQGRGRMRFSWA